MSQLNLDAVDVDSCDYHEEIVNISYHY